MAEQGGDLRSALTRRGLTAGFARSLTFGGLFELFLVTAVASLCSSAVHWP